jgi:hypothetical protein
VIVRLADDADLRYVMALQRANRESVGGLPEPAIRERIVARRVLVGILNEDLCGYVLCDPGRDGILRIPQACIEYDARRQTHGALLVGESLRLFPCHETRVRCAADLEANLFWQSLGFICTAHTNGGRRRGRILNLWQRWETDRLISLDTLAIDPIAQRREDCMYDDTGYLIDVPRGFSDGGSLGKLAWSMRRGGL